MTQPAPIGAFVATVLAVMLAAGAARGVGSFVNFESGHVRPLALSPNRATLFALNTPDNRVEIYAVKPAAPYLSLVSEVVTGLEPVAVAPRSNTEVWVVNHVSDSISILMRDSVASNEWRLARTLLTCDEPRDIVFSQNGLAFVSAARRGATCPLPPDSTQPGIGRGVIQVFDPANLGTAVGGVPKATIVIPGDVPRALAADPGSNFVYAGVFLSGSGTTTIPEPIVSFGKGLPVPKLQGVLYTNPGSFPRTGLIVKRVAAGAGWRWEDEDHRDWSADVPFELPDHDVFRISATDLTIKKAYAGVGAVLMNMAVRPGSGAIYVTDLEALNHVRFEPVLKGHFIESHLTRISQPNNPVIESIHLNGHIDYSVIPGTQAEIDCSIGLPGALTFSSDGKQLFLAAFGSARIAIFNDVANIPAAQCGLPSRRLLDVAAGPSGLVYDDFLRRLYVLSQLEPAVTVIDNNPLNAGSPKVLAVRELRFDPSPATVTNGRRLLYDTDNSAHGDSSCAACHIFGDFDGIAWDLGNPQAPNPLGGTMRFHPMKGPMTTQTLRGLAGAGQMHWRADRFGPTEKDAFSEFNPAFEGLLGGSELSNAEMSDFADFALTITYPPNPLRPLDGSLTPEQAQGQDLFDNQITTAGLLRCSESFCHANPLGTNGEIFSPEGLPQDFKVAHLRNLYQKVGMFASSPPQPQVRGFGYLHDGSIPTLFDFLGGPFDLDDQQRRQVEAYVLGFGTGLKPIVGQQVTLSAANLAQSDAVQRLDLLLAQAAQPDTCDLVAKALVSGESRGWLYQGGTFKSDKATQSASLSDLKNIAQTSPVTFTCVPPGSGTRIGIDRDQDATLDGDDGNDVGP